MPDRLPGKAGFQRPFQVTSRSVMAISLPMTLAYVTTPLLGLVDTAVVGRFADPAMLGGLASGSVVLSLVFASFNFLRSGTTGLIAQTMGEENEGREQATFWRAALLAAVIGLVVLVIRPWIISLAVDFMDAEPAVTRSMVAYLDIRLYSAPLALLNYVILGYALGRGAGRIGLILQLVLNGTNIALSIWFGLGMGLGIEGVAWGTIGAEAFAVLCGGLWVLRRFTRLSPPAWQVVFDGADFIRMIVLNRDIMIRSLALLFAFAVFTRQGAQLPQETLAANAVLLNFFLMSGFFLDGLASAAEQLGGRALGARYRPAFEAAVRLTLIWGFLLAVLAVLVFLLFGDGIIALLTVSPEVQTEASLYLPWAALTALSGVLAFQMDGIFIGATWSRDMRNMMLLSLAIYLASQQVLISLWGNSGLWASLHVLLIVRGTSLFLILPHRLRTTFGVSCTSMELQAEAPSNPVAERKFSR